MNKKYDFSGWATRFGVRCSDGRTIDREAFKHQDGATVPLVFMHDHKNIDNVLGKAHLENREDGVYAYCELNDTPNAQTAKELLKHGDVNALSIHANNLKQNGSYVRHGMIREVSLVLAGANPGAYIDSVMLHGEYSDEEALIYHDSIGISFEREFDDEVKHSEEEKKESKVAERTVKDVIDSMNDEQRKVFQAMVVAALEMKDDADDEEDEGENVKHNVFENDNEASSSNALTHSDEMAIISLAKQNNVGSLQTAMRIYEEENGIELQHAFTNDTIEGEFFPEYKWLKPGAPELITRDQSWVTPFMNKCSKTPFSRIRTRQGDIRSYEEINAKGYKKGKQKALMGAMTILKRSTDPQTIYVKDMLNRDDIVDITDFDVAEYQYQIMNMAIHEAVAVAALLGDGRNVDALDKISEEHIRPIWTDNEIYSMHRDVDIAAARSELQGTGTGVSFGDNYVYAEAIITASLYAREDYKGTGTPDFYCTPHLLNVMLLARDMNGRRIYESKNDLAKALNVGTINTVEQMENKVRTDSTGKKHKLLGIFVNPTDYNFGSTKGGQITRFEQFDIDFNQYKYLIETRLSGALTRPYAAIVLEEPVAVVSGGDQQGDDEEQPEEQPGS